MAKAAIAAAFGATLASAAGITAGALNAGLVLWGVENAEAHAMMAAKRKVIWKVFMVLMFSSGIDGKWRSDGCDISSTK